MSLSQWCRHSETHSYTLAHPTHSSCLRPGSSICSIRQMCEVQGLVCFTAPFSKLCRCRVSERIVYSCHFVRLLIPFVVAAALLTMSPSVLCILQEAYRSLSATDPSDNHILRVSKCGDKWSGEARACAVCVFVCAAA